MSAPAIALRDVWKVFGHAEARALQAARAEGASKDEVLARHACVVAVAGATLSVARGEVFCVMGLSGSGKSTLVRLVNGLVRPSAGAVLVEGEDVAGLSAPALRALRGRRIGMVFQSFGLMPHRSVVENVAFGLELRGAPRAERLARAARMLDLVQLTGWGERFPDQLSGGMRQRVGLARALAGDPDILLMDEPFGALDPLIRRQLQDEFARLARAMGKTVMFITHDLDEAMRIGDRIAIMRDGRIVQTGAAGEIVRAPADAYVAAFLSGLSRVRVMRASDVMAPLDPAAPPPADAPSAPADASLAALARIAAGARGPVVIHDAAGRAVGTADAARVLAAVGSEADG